MSFGDGENVPERFYRIQPRGLPVRGHRSTASTDELVELFVFDEPWQTLQLDGPVEFYGDEVVEIEAPQSWTAGDVEGVLVESDRALVTRRWSLDEWGRALGRGADVPAGTYAELVEMYEEGEIADAIQAVHWSSIPGARSVANLRRLRADLLR